MSAPSTARSVHGLSRWLAPSVHDSQRLRPCAMSSPSPAVDRQVLHPDRRRRRWCWWPPSSVFVGPLQLLLPSTRSVNPVDEVRGDLRSRSRKGEDFPRQPGKDQRRRDRRPLPTPSTPWPCESAGRRAGGKRRLSPPSPTSCAPLSTAIKGWAETLVGDSADRETTEKGIGVILKETDRLSAMVEELLHFSRLQSGRLRR